MPKSFCIEFTDLTEDAQNRLIAAFAPSINNYDYYDTYNWFIDAALCNINITETVKTINQDLTNGYFEAEKPNNKTIN